MVKIILWDIDGTLLDFLLSEKIAIRTCFEKLGLGACTDEMIADYSKINVGYWKKLENGEMTKDRILVERFKEFFRLYKIDESKAGAFNAEYQVRLGDTAVFTPGAKETLLELQGKVIQACVTNGTKIAQSMKLKRSGMDRIFDHVFISEDIGFEKPSSAFFEKVFAELTSCQKINNDSPEDGLNLDKSEILIVGDSLTSDIQGGKNAGIKTCWYNPNHVNLPENAPVPDFEIHAISEIKNCL